MSFFSLWEVALDWSLGRGNEAEEEDEDEDEEGAEEGAGLEEERWGWQRREAGLRAEASEAWARA